MLILRSQKRSSIKKILKNLAFYGLFDQTALLHYHQPAMLTFRTLLLLTLLLGASTLSLEGNWQLIALQSSPVSVPVIIDEFIFGESEIMKRVIIKTCNNLIYNVNIDADNFWIDIDSQQVHLSANCTPNETKLAMQVRYAIRTVATFKILVSQLVLYDSSLEAKLLFQRSSSSISKSIAGSWLMSFIADESNTYVFVADDTTITVCDRATFKYSLQKLYGISIQVQSPSSCSQAVLSSISSAAFFRIKEGILQIYDQSVNKIAYGVNSPASTPPSMIIPSSTPVQTGIADGKYILLLLFRRDLMRVILQIENSTIALTICSKLIFTYSLGQSSSIGITSSSVPNPKCNKADETIYFQYFTSASSYSIDSSGVITLSDTNKKQIISLSPQ